ADDQDHGHAQEGDAVAPHPGRDLFRHGAPLRRKEPGPLAVDGPVADDTSIIRALSPAATGPPGRRGGRCPPGRPGRTPPWVGPAGRAPTPRRRGPARATRPLRGSAGPRSSSACAAAP